MTQTGSEIASNGVDTKRAQILRGAGTVFIENGYSGASMSQIAHVAGVSKGALYNHFESKAALFSAFFEETCQTRLSVLENLAHDDTLSIEDALFQLTQATIHLMLDHNSVGLYRIILVDAPRFPNLVETFWKHGIGRMLSNMQGWLTRQTTKGTLFVDDPSFAAEQFLLMCQARIVQRHRLSLPIDCSPAHIKKIAQRTAECFLRIYAPD